MARLGLLMMLVVAIASVSARAESDSASMPKFDSLKELADELNETVRGDDEPMPRENNPERQARGKELYRQNCIQCHGENAVGAPDWYRRDAAGNFPPPPLNGTAHTWHHPKKQLIEMIKVGGDVMPPFNTKLSDGEIVDIIKWFQSFWPDELYYAWSRQNRNFEQSVE